MNERWDELLRRDHEVTERVFASMEAKFSTAEVPPPALVGLLVDYLHYVDRCHNQKEELHLFPRLEAAGMPRHGGPLGVMLQEPERAQQILARLVPLATAYAGGGKQALAELRAAFGEYASLCKDHFWKENDILYPMALRMLGEAEAAEVAAGIEEAEASHGAGTRERYYRIAQEIVDRAELRDLSFGLEHDVLAAILNTLPVELSFIDHEDRVRYFSHEHGEKIFGRTRGAIGTAAELPPAEEPAPGQPDPRRLQGRQARSGRVLDRDGRTYGAHHPHAVNNAMDAYAIMGVEFGSSLADVTASFRTKAKQLHPDANNSDRTSEPELRRMLEAYQFLKEYLSLSNTEPMPPPDRPYSPSE